ncbi:molybdate ABC transporter permease subunit [Neisseriaceae bacterium JH1-16]|nr:molybdate ABC transporter permease subunit [Neisseriaceae bacterium JH1-16]
MFADLDWGPLWLTAELAAITTLILFLLGVPLAGWIAHSRSRFKPLVETLVSMPLVLPPSVLGFYLLLTLSPNNTFGAWLAQTFNLRLVFTFEGLVVGSVLYSLPFMVQPVQAALTNLPPSLREASYTLGKSRLATFWRVELPSVRPALLVGTVMAFAHTVGEFGVVLMIGGNIPDQTRVASIAIYNEVEIHNYSGANAYSMVLVAFCFVIVFVLNWLNRRHKVVLR